MINPKEITDYNRNDWDIQLFFIFCVAVAGNKSKVMARKVQDLSDGVSEEMGENPFYETHPMETGVLHYLLGFDDVPDFGLNKMKAHKFGKYGQWDKLFTYFQSMSQGQAFGLSDWLRNATIQQLERIPSVGKKTSRFFKLHSDPNAECVPLDTHILKFVRSRHGHDPDYIPKTTPTSIYEYQSIETFALKYMRNYMSQKRIKTLAEADLAIWTSYAYTK